MNIRLFNAKYTIRRFSEQQNVRGYFVSPHSDFTVSIDVSPSGSDSAKNQPEGENYISYLDGWGEVELRTADPKTGTWGDLLWYHGDWYECTSCVRWDHTLLSHFNYHFAMAPRTSANSSDLEPPESAEESGDSA